MLHKVYMCACYAKQKISLASPKVGGPTSITAVEWNLKVKDTVHNVVHYCITVSMQKISSIHKLILKNTADFKVSWTKWLCLFLTLPHQKSLKQIFAFLNLHQQAKNQFISSPDSWDTVKFRVSWPDWPHPFLIMPTQNVFDQLLIVVNLCQHAKNLAISLIFSADMVH